MATTAQEWQQSGDEMNRVQPEPIITYDHMSDAEHTLYFSTGNKITNISNSHLLIEGVLIAGMLIALILLTF